METIIITGGTGLIGKALTKVLVAKGYDIIILTRKIPAGNRQPGVSFALWDIKAGSIDVDAVKKADHIIHLAGAGVVDKRWTDAYKKEIVDSRIKGSALIVDTLKQHNNKVKTIVSASGIGWYGADNENSRASGFKENSAPAQDFLGKTCRLWEESIDAAAATGKRIVKIRTGIVLSKEDGALPEFKKPLNLGIAAVLGNGNQIVSWIHIDDLCRVYAAAIENTRLNGAYNAAAPNPVSNKTLTLELAKITRGNFYIPVHVPPFVLKIVMGESSVEVLKSCTVSCEKIKETGFTFIYPSIEAALTQIYKQQ